ncbi:MAG: nucleoside triphosphate pyrophosphohydrolase [Planctomycetota bacterium]|nr:nucleoside triphosphate pyrophosphohydrolase [Planctomycetota bacterium]
MSVRTAPPTVDPHAAAADPRAVAFARLLAVVDRLRAPDGCPWDLKQTLSSMAPHLVEEAHEAVEAIERGHLAQTAEECGDVLMVVALLCRIAQDAGQFDLAAAAHGISEKLIRRHPHLFGEVQVDSADQVVQNWEAIKKVEREEKQEDSSAIAGVPVALPALQRAHRVGGKAVSAGFRWADPRGALAKLREEQGELEVALQDVDLSKDGMPGAAVEARARVEHELGDVLLAAAFLARYLDVDAERITREAVRRFEGRFRAMESSLGVPMKDATLDRMMAAWQAAKSAEKGAAP